MPREWRTIASDFKYAELAPEDPLSKNSPAGMVGYGLQTNFARDLPKQFGMTPSKFIHNKPAENNLQVQSK